MIKKKLKINIKNTQIAKAIKLDKLKEKLEGKKAEVKKKKSSPAKVTPEKIVPAKAKKVAEDENIKTEKEETPRRKARSKSFFTEATAESLSPLEVKSQEKPSEKKEAAVVPEEAEQAVEPALMTKKEEELPAAQDTVLGPTGRHIKDILPPKRDIAKEEKKKEKEPSPQQPKEQEKKAAVAEPKTPEEKGPLRKGKPSRFKEFRDVKPTYRPQRFDGRDRHGLRDTEEENRWRKKRSVKQAKEWQEETTIRPASLKVRLPISIKDLAAEMKLKASQLIAKLFLQGLVVTINDLLEDETTIQLLGEEFGCEIQIDTSEEERIRITDQSIKEEIKETANDKLQLRAPVVTFMGHVDHGKTSLIDYIRKTSTLQGEAGAITQHIGAFLCTTSVGNLAIIDTPGHEAFSAMRARGTNVTDIVVLVIAGDEGIRAQTEEAIEHAKAADVTLVVAINKSDKPNFDRDNVYRQLADHELLPEAWGGQTITVNCSAVTGDGVKDLLEMLALQAEILELKASQDARARGTVLESEVHKGLGAVATILVQNGTLKVGDSLVFGEYWGHVKTIRNEFGELLLEAGPSTPVEITGISGLPEAGQEFIVVPSEREARQIADARMIGKRQLYLQQTKRVSVDNLFQQVADQKKKVLKIVLRTDVQGSLEALKTALLKIESDKAEIDIISSAVGAISESDVLLAAASKAIILAFHTKVEPHAELLVKQHGVHISSHDVIYHAIDSIKALMTALLDRIAQETDKGKAEVKAVFKASQLGKIAGCLVTEGVIHRNHLIRVIRDGQLIWSGSVASIKRVKEDVREVQKGVECGILLSNFNNIEVDDILEAYEITYISQEL
ncbi:MAG: translation initiation factor IF-2 [Waddliaceae bacterium]